MSKTSLLSLKSNLVIIFISLFIFHTLNFAQLNSNGGSNDPANNKIDWREQIIYMALTDRFFNGDSSNDELGACDCYDPSNPLMYHGGDIAGFSQKLDYLKELGITALWTSPLYEQVPKHAVNAGRDEERDDTPACGYHGYVINFRYPDDRAVEPKFGTSDEVHNLIAELKKNDIHMIFDMLVNQAGWNADIVEAKPDWFNKLEDDGKNNDCAYLDVYHMCIYGLPDFKIDDPIVGAEVREYLNNMSAGWIEEYDIAGIRFDAPMLVPPTYFPEWFETVRNVKSDLFIFAETYDYNRPQNYKPYLEAGFNGTLNFYLQGAFKETFAYGNSTNVIAENMKNTIEDLGLEQTQLMVNFIDNHDITRFMTHDRGETGLISEDVRRQHLALTALLTLPGIPQIYYGNEIGAFGAYPNNRRDMPNWAWDEAARGGDHPNFLSDADKTFELTKKLVEIRKNNPALTKGNYFEIARQGSDSNPNIYIFLREFEQSKILMIFNNEEVPVENYKIDLKQTELFNSGINQELMNCEMKDLLKFGAPTSLEISNGEFTFDMKSKSAGIYIISN